MTRRIRQLYRLGGFGDEADKPLAPLHARFVDGAGIKAFGGEQFQDIAGAPEIDGANLGDHVAGDRAHQSVEPVLGRSVFRHDVANGAQ